MILLLMMHFPPKTHLLFLLPLRKCLNHVLTPQIGPNTPSLNINSSSLSSQKIYISPKPPPHTTLPATMHKVFRRTLLAEKQAARRLAAKKVTKKRDLAKSIRQQVSHTRKEETADLKQARLVRREDYELGPLAPRRDVGDKVDSYGSIGGHRTQRDLLRPKVLMETLKSVGGVYMNIVAGDRVVLLEGKDKGKIGKVLQTDKMRASCTVEGMNVVSTYLRPLSQGIQSTEPVTQLTTSSL